MRRLTMYISEHPVLSFYIICFALTWTLFLPILLSKNDLFELVAVLGIFGGPGVATILVARGSGTEPVDERHPPFWPVFIGAWIVCTAIFLAYQRMSNPLPNLIAYAIFALLGIIPAFLLASAWSGPTGVRRALHALPHPTGHPAWYLLALALPLIVQIASLWLSNVLGWGLLSEPSPPSEPVQLTGEVLVVFLYTFVFAGGINEEIGWTGLALPRLLMRVNPLVATVVVWGLWMMWHVPFHLAGYFDLSLHVLIGSFFGRFLMTWLFVRSSGGILTAMLLHSSVNVTSQFFPLTYASLPVWAVAAALVILGDKMWRKLPLGNATMYAGSADAQRGIALLDPQGYEVDS